MGKRPEVDELFRAAAPQPPPGLARQVADAVLNRVTLVGEANPYQAPDAGDEFSLWPDPPNSSGHRLCYGILGLAAAEYVRSYDRANLCGVKFYLRPARERAVALAETHRPLVLLGRKVTSAFRTPYTPYVVREVYGETMALVLPHPSGLCRAWNNPGEAERARAAVAAFRASLV